ncbi:DUF222 domain-containing protein [Arthrobacter sp. UKPF54-2]|uniref:HNH endonuclease signature motif containing protein n=1 Tax=Arthrobacter sp. UKPF54-2 TaxID=2600159 RepID=UPI0011B155C8|nr:HNH endonuclease signature motif containing protein [Arthrobacter sp. UKPF54-2]QDY89107.1 DUF222 domain-containing protein [Arthrobacter sp. UKPF54-2]
MGIGAALIARPAGRPDGEGRRVPPLDSVLGQLRGVCATAVGDAALLGFGEAAEFAGRVEEISRAAEYLQLVAAGAVQRTRFEAANDGAPALDDGYRKTSEFLRDQLQISAVEAHRRLTLACELLPRTGMTGQPLPPLREELAAAVAAGAVPSRSATIITHALGRVRPVCDPETSARMEHALTRTAAEHDPDFLTRIARRWVDAIDQDGAEPSEEVLRQLQGAFIRKPRHGLQHLEIFATTEQFEHLLTVMNTATNPRTGSGADGSDAAANGTDVETGADGFVPNVLDRRSRPQKHLDGLVGGCKIAMASGGLPAAGGLRPQVMVTIDYRDLLDRLTRAAEASGGQAPGADSAVGSPAPPAAGRFTGNATLGFTGTGTMAFTGPVTAATIRKIACDADIIPVLLGSEGRVLDVGRTTRVFPPHIRKAITARDQGCTFPGCTIPAPWCEAHHITYWSRAGTTSTDNGTLLCSHHHHLIHKEQWTIQPRSGIPWFIPPPHLDPHQTPRRNHYFRC